MNPTRRDFVRQAGLGMVGTASLFQLTSLPLSADPTSKHKQPPTLVAIYLRGGADALGTVMPVKDKRYKELRPTIAIPGPENGSAGALPLDENFGFNPNLKELHALYEKGLCVPILCVGSPHPTRSHFDAQDFMERGAPGQKTIATGWLNRYLQETKSKRDAQLRAFAPQPLLPRSMRGDYPVLAKPDQSADLALQVYGNIYPANMKGEKKATDHSGKQTKQTIQDFGTRTIAELRELNAILEKTPTTAKYPTSGFARQMRDIAKVIKADRGLEVTALDYGGWDHHIDLGPVSGQLGKRLADVSATLGAFVEDLGPRMNQVLVLVMSEFGRQVKENGNHGADHGHGGFMLAIGGKVAGKKVYGKWLGLEDNHLYQKRDLPVTTDFRVVFAETLQGVFGYDGIQAGLFPEYTPDAPPLGFLKS